MRFSLFAILLIGCGGADSAVSAPAPSPDASADATAPPSTPDADAAPPNDAGVDAAPKDDRIDPIALGRSWTYEVTILGTYPLCQAGSNTGNVIGQTTVDGKSAFQVQSFCPGAGTSSYAVDGDKVEIYYANTWVLSLDAPVQAGHTWTDGVFNYSWQETGHVSTPAGEFDNCWTAKPDISTSYTTFCRGVGPVRWHYVDTTGNGYDATLTAFAP